MSRSCLRCAGLKQDTRTGGLTYTFGAAPPIKTKGRTQCYDLSSFQSRSRRDEDGEDKKRGQGRIRRDSEKSEKGRRRQASAKAQVVQEDSDEDEDNPFADAVPKAAKASPKKKSNVFDEPNPFDDGEDSDDDDDGMDAIWAKEKRLLGLREDSYEAWKQLRERYKNEGRKEVSQQMGR